MHCHTSEGSPDSMVSVKETATKLISKGYNGMLVTDHNSYKGYQAAIDQGLSTDDFTILRGVEYDTKDGGHMIIVLPTEVDCNLLNIRGMTLSDTIKVVHLLGGIIGPAHPFDYYKLGVGNTKLLQNLHLIKKFDFIETHNSCGGPAGNALAKQLSIKLDKPQLGGSDSHKLESVGLTRTILSKPVSNENELIDLIKDANNTITAIEGKIYRKAMHNRYKKLYKAGIAAFCLMNGVAALTNQHKINKLLEILIS